MFFFFKLSESVARTDLLSCEITINHEKPFQFDESRCILFLISKQDLTAGVRMMLIKMVSFHSLSKQQSGLMSSLDFLTDKHFTEEKSH